MANEDYAYGQQYSTVFTHVAQQIESVLKPLVWNEAQDQEFKHWNSIGTIGSTSSPARAASTAENALTHYRRRVPINQYVITHYWDRTEALEMIADPTSPYVEAEVRQMNRDIDSVIITAAQATAYTDKTGSTSTSYSASMTVASGSTGLTVTKIKSAKLKLDNNDVPQDGRVLVISPAAEADLIDDSTVASIAYMATRSLPTGRLPNILGFTIAVSTQLAAVGSIRDCLYFHKDSLMFVDGKDRLGSTTIVNNRADLNNARQIQTFYHIGACRMDETGVGVIEVIE